MRLRRIPVCLQHRLHCNVILDVAVGSDLLTDSIFCCLTPVNHDIAGHLGRL